MENPNRIQINGVWYVRESQPKPIVKTVNWLIAKLQEWAELGHGECPVTMQIDYGNDYDLIEYAELIGVAGNYRVEIS
jgi:hypothetical protein